MEEPLEKLASKYAHDTMPPDGTHVEPSLEVFVFRLVRQAYIDGYTKGKFDTESGNPLSESKADKPQASQYWWNYKKHQE